ncbi:MAG: type II toxin-antitoxin system RelE/ParE family toxin [Acidobacteria bacterium]|nr:type II toxin-antitoxin system RelE/ParE family toxin [Acidobacteriota bacterium]HMU33215.1 hypothetical protein [Pyrinomonadaceae bacterium]
MNVHILDGAEEDLANGYWFYEQQETGLGAEFLRSILTNIRKLEAIGGIHPIYHEPYHQMFTRRFPYAIYYLIENDEVMVDAVIDCRRGPEWISDRLS